MRIVILAPGSRGDVQPFVALSRALGERGHGVTLAADRVFHPMAAKNAIEFIGVAFDTRSILQDEQQAFARTNNPLALLRGLSRRGQEMSRAWAEAVIPVAPSADLILAGGGAIYMALSLAEVGRQAVAQAMLQPFFPTAAFPSPIVPPRRWPGGINRLSHAAMLWLFYVMFRRSTNFFRVEGLGLPPWSLLPPPMLRRPSYLALCAVSPSVVAPPADMPSNVRMTGYWFLDDRTNWEPDPDLADFLSAGSPPILVGFGSMIDSAAAERTRQICAALELTGQRAILARGWGGVASHLDSHRFHVIDEAPHDRLLPHCAGFLHHGGAGTIAAALRAGVPQIVAPVMADQPFWAQRAMDLGVSAATIPHKHLTAPALAAAIERLIHDDGLRRRAAHMAEALSRENGLAAAVQAIEAMQQTRSQSRHSASVH